MDVHVRTSLVDCNLQASRTANQKILQMIGESNSVVKLIENSGCFSLKKLKLNQFLVFRTPLLSMPENTAAAKYIQGEPIKNVPLYFCSYLHQLLTNFRNSFARTLCGQFAIM